MEKTLKSILSFYKSHFEVTDNDLIAAAALQVDHFLYLINSLLSCAMCLIELTVSHIESNIIFVLIHTSIVNGNQLLCDALTVPE